MADFQDGSEHSSPKRSGFPFSFYYNRFSFNIANQRLIFVNSTKKALLHERFTNVGTITIRCKG